LKRCSARQSRGDPIDAPEDGILSHDQPGELDDVSRQAPRRILEASDAARRRFARDLHDGAQQKFVTAVINLQLAQARFASEPERARDNLAAALDQAESGLGALRDLVAGIHPPVLTHLGLKAAIESLADGFPIPIALSVTDQRLPDALEESVYFVVSEALTNVIKHARATRAGVQIAVGSTLLTVEVSDDGIGGATLSGGGSGLMGLMDRMQALNGELTLASPPTGGTVLLGVIPLPADGI
jgi:signal transduction histidine kinase